MSEDKTKPQSSIPVSKVERATKFVKTGVKVGGNYIKHYAKKMIDPSLDRQELDHKNASDIYDALSELKGSALKVAQMMSLDKNMLPKAYSEKFSMAQYSAPPLSYPLVVKTFNTHFGKSPSDMFDSFTKDAVNAASIGQVHQATKDGKKLAVKVQYPGVADSISSDLKMVKPFALQLLGMSERDLELYMEEVEKMLVAETDYELELRRSQNIATACAHIPNLVFASYYPEYSSKRVLTMDWLDGKHLNDFLATEPSQQIRDAIGQAMWDFYDFQIHSLLEVHADPHPGNFLMRPDGSLGIIDFGCIKVIPEEYYHAHFQIIDFDVLANEQELKRVFTELSFLYAEDSGQEKEFFFTIFRDMIQLTVEPLRHPLFDFGNDEYFSSLYEMGERLSQMEELRKSKRPRGSKHSLYLNRTYFGLYTLLHDLKAKVRTRCQWYDQRGKIQYKNQ